MATIRLESDIEEGDASGSVDLMRTTEEKVVAKKEVKTVEKKPEAKPEIVKPQQSAKRVETRP